MDQPWSVGAEFEDKVKDEKTQKIKALGLKIMRLCNDANIEGGDIVDVLAKVLGSYVGVTSMGATSEEHRQAIYAIPHVLLGLYAKEPNYEKYLSPSGRDELRRLRSESSEL